MGFLKIPIQCPKGWYFTSLGMFSVVKFHAFVLNESFVSFVMNTLNESISYTGRDHPERKEEPCIFNKQIFFGV